MAGRAYEQDAAALIALGAEHGWLVELTDRLPGEVPAAACPERRVLLLNEFLRPPVSDVRAWLCGGYPVPHAARVGENWRKDSPGSLLT